MNNQLVLLSKKLDLVSTTEEFEEWVRFDLRHHLPHASLLVTMGKLYGVGSIPTHRIAVDFPLGMVEALKNSAGALDDPLIYGWFRSEKLRHTCVSNIDENGGQQRWRRVLIKYGMRDIIIHGVLNHVAKRFAVFQFFNPHGGGLQCNVKLVSELIAQLSKAAWRTVDSRFVEPSRTLIGHPTLSLTSTELQIIELLAQGLSNKEIARRRGVSDSTVKTQVQRTGAKLGATRRSEIVALALPMLSPLPSQTLIDYGDFTNLKDGIEDQ